MKTTSGRALVIIALLVGSVIGVAAGASIHFQRSVGGLGGVLGAGMTFAGIAVAVGVSTVIAVIAALAHRKGATFVFGTLASGIVIGGVLGTFVGPTYQPPTTATGTVKVVFTKPSTPAWTGTATCTTIENGHEIASITSPKVATLDRQAVWLRLDLGGDVAPAALVIGQPLDEERTPPFPYREYGAAGPSLGAGVFGPDRRAGTIPFGDLALVTGQPLPLDPPTSHLAGHVEWTCQG